MNHSVWPSTAFGSPVNASGKKTIHLSSYILWCSQHLLPVAAAKGWFSLRELLTKSVLPQERRGNLWGIKRRQKRLLVEKLENSGVCCSATSDGGHLQRRYHLCLALSPWFPASALHFPHGPAAPRFNGFINASQLALSRRSGSGCRSPCFRAKKKKKQPRKHKASVVPATLSGSRT